MTGKARRSFLATAGHVTGNRGHQKIALSMHGNESGSIGGQKVVGKMSDYTPIPCSIYDRYEIAILHHTPLRTSWRDDTGMTHVETLQPLDLITSNGEEFLRARQANGQTIELRLDHILEAVPLR